MNALLRFKPQIMTVPPSHKPKHQLLINDLGWPQHPDTRGQDGACHRDDPTVTKGTCDVTTCHQAGVGTLRPSSRGVRALSSRGVPQAIFRWSLFVTRRGPLGQKNRWIGHLSTLKLTVEPGIAPGHRYSWFMHRYRVHQRCFFISMVHGSVHLGFKSIVLA